MPVSAPRIQRVRSKLPARSAMAILVGLLFWLAPAHAGDVGTEHLQRDARVRGALRSPRLRRRG